MSFECQFYDSFCSIPHEFLNCPLGRSKNTKKNTPLNLILNIRDPTDYSHTHHNCQMSYDF